jgi:hypothetical protein
MGADGVFPAEMPERGSLLAGPLDRDTAERLVAGRVGSDDAPPGYAGVASVLQAAAGPAAPEELAGREAALAMFRAHGPAGERGHARRRVRARVVALAVAGAVAAGGLWMAGAAPFPAGLPSRAGAPQSGGAGASAPADAASGLVTQARPATPPVTAAGANVRAPAQEPVTARAASGASGHGTKHPRPGKPPKSKPKPKPGKSKPGPKPKHQG